MTREEILKMPAGSEIELLISDHVLKLSTLEWNRRFFNNRTKFSTDIAAAWEVVEKINQMITNGHLTLEDDYNYLTLEFLGTDSGYAVSFDCIVNDSEWYEQGTIEKYKYAARADTAPLAICRAALLAVMEAQ